MRWGLVSPVPGCDTNRGRTFRWLSVGSTSVVGRVFRGNSVYLLCLSWLAFCWLRLLAVGMNKLAYPVSRESQAFWCGPFVCTVSCTEWTWQDIMVTNAAVFTFHTPADRRRHSALLLL